MSEEPRVGLPSEGPRGGVDLDTVRADLEQLIAIAADAATSLEELVEVAHAAASLGSPVLLEVVAAKLAAEVRRTLGSAGAWEAELTYSKIDAWSQTGHRARLLAEAWAVVAAGLSTPPAAT